MVRNVLGLVAVCPPFTLLRQNKIMSDSENLERILGLLEDALGGSIDAGDKYDSAVEAMSDEEARWQLKILAEIRPDVLREFHKEQGVEREDVEEIYLQAGLTSEQIDSLFEGYNN